METETTATHAQANEVFFHGWLEYVFYLSDKKMRFTRIWVLLSQWKRLKPYSVWYQLYFGFIVTFKNFVREQMKRQTINAECLYDLFVSDLGVTHSFRSSLSAWPFRIGS